MIGFIVLHYNNVDITLKCLKFLKKICDDNSKIIVVDNNTLVSADENKLKKYTIDILKLDKNYGYAVANNRGIEYAKLKYDCDFYVVINNDVYIQQKDFIYEIKETYKKYKFDLLGPLIKSSSGESVNPFPVLKTSSEVKKEIDKCRKLIRIYNSRLLTILLNIYIKIKHIIIAPTKPINGKKVTKNVALHGCAIIMSKKYIKKYKYPFYEKTFLFHEEEFIYRRIINDKLISIYNPKLEVYHLEGTSTNNKNSRLKKLFRERERIKSLNLLLEECLLEVKAQNEKRLN